MTNLITTKVDPAKTRPVMRGIESVFAAGLYAPGVTEALQALGLELVDLAEVNVVTRVAPMGPVNGEVAWSVIYNHNPSLVKRLIPAVWAVASPERILATQSDAFSPVLAAGLASIDPAELKETADLARTVAQAAARNHEGRALFAGLASLPWPTEDHLVIWHAAKLLREHRGDSHVAVLVTEGLHTIDVLAIHAAFDEKLPASLLRRSRRWTRDDWAATVADLRTRGWLTAESEGEHLVLSEAGRERRQWIEDRTDLLASRAYEPIGNDGMDRLAQLGVQVAKALKAAGLGLPRGGIPLGDD
jgi:hypothetical protein